nr:hypothetical protein [uncultured Bacteroides sp.]
MIYDDKLGKLVSLAYYDGRMKLAKGIYRAFRDGTFKLVWARVNGDYILVSPDILKWPNDEIGKEYPMRVQTNKKWELVELEELL